MTELILIVAAFFAGFIDSIVGGGGLIQTPAALLSLPQFSIAEVIGSVKIPSFSGTFAATLQYAKRIVIQWKFLLPVACLTGISSYIGSVCLTKVENDFMMPVLLIVLIGISIYTFLKRDFGQKQSKIVKKKAFLFKAIFFAVLIGFYDGFIGPGTGSFFVLVCIIGLGMDFLHASTYAKLCNLATNLGSIILFVFKGIILWQFAIPMAFSNVIGSVIGSRLALKNGNGFIRKVFLCVLILTISRFAYVVFQQYL